MHKAIEKLAGELTPEYIRLWKDICEIETPSDHKARIDRMADRLEDFALKKGFSVVRTAFPRAGDCLCVDLPGTGAPIGLMGHMDTVHPVGAFGDEPVKIVEDTIYGPGAADCKGGIVQGLMVMDILHRLDTEHPAVRLLLTADEEVSARFSGEAGIAYIKEHMSPCRAVFNCEPGRSPGHVVGRKGIVNLLVEVAGKAAHAGSAPGDGISAVTEAAHKIIAINAMSDPENVTCNCSMVRGGDSSNTIPQTCSFTVDIRSFTPADLDSATDKVRAICANTVLKGTKTTVTVNSIRPPMEAKAFNYELLKKLNGTAEKLGRKPMSHALSGGGSDACYTVACGVPTLCGCGPEGKYLHTPEEQANIPSLTKNAILYTNAILDF